MAPETSAPALEAGSRFRLAKGGRRGTFEFGQRLDSYGSVRVVGRGDVPMTFAGREYAIRPSEDGLVLLDDDGREVGRFTDGRKGTGQLTVAGAEFAATFPRKRRTTGTLSGSDGTPVAELRLQNGVILIEVSRSLDPLVAAFTTAALALRLSYRPPAPAITPVWEPARAARSFALWGVGLGAAGFASGWGGDDWGGGDFGGGGDCGGGGDGGGGGN